MGRPPQDAARAERLYALWEARHRPKVAENLIALRNVEKWIGERKLLDEVSLAIDDRERVGLIGANGSGKTTLLSILTGTVAPDAGSVIKRRDLSFALSAQFPALPPTATVQEATDQGLAENRRIREALEKNYAAVATAEGVHATRLATEQASLTDALENCGGFQVEHRKDAALAALRVPPANRVVSTLSLGEARRLSLAISLIEPKRLLILDEPTNHLDIEGVEWLETAIKEYPGAVLLVSHDRALLDSSCERMLELDRGRLSRYAGNYSEYMVARAERYAQEAAALARTDQMIAQELAWSRKSAPARTTKQKARLKRLDTALDGRPEARIQGLRFRIPHPKRIGKTILELENVGQSVADRRLFAGVDLKLLRGERLGIIGPNGAGKTTLLRTIIGELAPEAGTVLQGQNTHIVYADQARTHLNPEDTALDAISGGQPNVWVGEEPVSAISFAESLHLSAQTMRTKVGLLSGGEKSRVVLAHHLAKAANLLILDEPTNDLDLPTLRVLEEALDRYPGCALIVSHDRWFLDRVATAILAFEDGQVQRYEGAYADYCERQAVAAPVQNAPKTPVSTPTPSQTKPQKKKKRGYNEEREYQGMEEKILALEAETEALEAKLHDPEQIRTLGAQIGPELERLETQKAEIEALYSRWEVLAALGD